MLIPNNRLPRSAATCPFVPIQKPDGSLNPVPSPIHGDNDYYKRLYNACNNKDHLRRNIKPYKTYIDLNGYTESSNYRDFYTGLGFDFTVPSGLKLSAKKVPVLAYNQINEEGMLKVSISPSSDFFVDINVFVNQEEMNIYEGDFIALRSGLDKFRMNNVDMPLFRSKENYLKYGHPGTQSLALLLERYPQTNYVICKDKECRMVGWWTNFKIAKRLPFYSMKVMKDGHIINKRNVDETSTNTERQKKLDRISLNIEDKAKHNNIVPKDFDILKADSGEIDHIMRQLEQSDSSFTSSVKKDLVELGIIEKGNIALFDNILRDLNGVDYDFVKSVLNVTNEQADSLTISQIKQQLGSMEKDKANAIVHVLEEAKIIPDNHTAISRAYESIRNNKKILFGISGLIASMVSIAGAYALYKKKYPKGQQRIPSHDIEMNDFSTKNIDYVRDRSAQIERINNVLTNKSELTQQEIQQIDESNEELQQLTNNISTKIATVHGINTFLEETHKLLDYNKNSINTNLKSMCANPYNKQINKIIDDHTICIRAIQRDEIMSPEERFRTLNIAGGFFEAVCQDIRSVLEGRQQTLELLGKNNYSLYGEAMLKKNLASYDLYFDHLTLATKDAIRPEGINEDSFKKLAACAKQLNYNCERDPIMADGEFILDMNDPTQVSEQFSVMNNFCDMLKDKKKQIKESLFPQRTTNGPSIV